MSTVRSSGGVAAGVMVLALVVDDGVTGLLA
jgi:hypothetical protein